MRQSNVEGVSSFCSGTVPTAEIIPRIESVYCDAKYVDRIVRHEFTFNEQTYHLGASIDWLTNPSGDIEWQILQHKFYYLPGLAEQYCLTKDQTYLNCLDNLIRTWVEQTPPGFIACDVTARRVQNWIYAFSILNQGGPYVLPTIASLVVESIVEQIDFVMENLAPARNHRTLELYSIFVAAVALNYLPQAKRWREFSVEKMVENIDLDLLTDGVHCELSTDYHHIVLRSYLLFYRLAKLHDIQLPEGIEERLCAALDFTMHIHRPDGMIPALSDGDSGDYRELLVWGSELFGRKDYLYVASSGNKGEAPKRKQISFANSGYAIQRSAWNGGPYRNARYLVFDAGPVGAGNHGHMDALSIEVYAYGQPLIIDPGRFTYDESGTINWRAKFRGNQAHNTITVDGMDQACYRSNRTNKRSKIGAPYPDCRLTAVGSAGEVEYLQGQVVSPNYDARHDRKIWFIRGLYWVVLDTLTSPSEHEYRQRFQLCSDLPPESQIQALGDFCRVEAASLTVYSWCDREEILIEDGFFSAAYGKKSAAPRICVKKWGKNANFLTFLIPEDRDSHYARSDCEDGASELQIQREGRLDRWYWNKTSQDLQSPVLSNYLDKQKVWWHV